MLSCMLWMSSDAQAADATPNAVLREVRKITTPDGIDEERFVTLGGVPQWISVRSRDRDAPILLFLHGGPAFTVSPVSYYYMRDWEEFFTVVQWDQRGAGKSFRPEDKAVLAPTMTIDRIVADAEELVTYLRKQYNHDRIVLMAHSFGTIPGVKLAQRHPDWFYAYVGMGQFVEFMRNEALGYAATLADARAQKNEDAIKDLEAIAPFPDRANPQRNLQNLPKERRWLAHYGGYYRAGGSGYNDVVARLSPTHTSADLKLRDEAHDFSVEHMWDEVGRVDLSRDVKFKLPVLIMQGRHDRGTSSALAQEWFLKLKSPHKKLVWFEDSSHMVYEEEPGKLLMALVNEVLPLTRKK